MNGAPPTERLSIGTFARETRLTPRALRLYAALGLLTPAFTDPESGYRYYAPGQVAQAHLIALLRQLDMPLTRVAEVLELQGQAAANEVGAYWREVERDADTKRRLVHYLETFLSGKGEGMYDIQLREVPQQKVVTLTRALLVGNLPGFIDSAHRDLYGVLAQAGLQAGPTSFVIYHGRVDEDNDGPVEVCVPFEGVLEPRGEMRIRLESAHHEVFTTITRAQCEFPGILQAYDAVFVHTRQQGLKRTGSPSEVYFTSESGVGDDAPFCDIAFPVEQPVLQAGTGTAGGQTR